MGSSETDTSTTSSSNTAPASCVADRFRLLTSDEAYNNIQEKFDMVVFCAPPSGFDDYPQAVHDAIERLWKKRPNDATQSAGEQQHGLFVFTSSGAV
jgi:hypothetical protein